MKIIKIQKTPWWMTWTVDQLQVTVELDDGTQKTVGIYLSLGFETDKEKFLRYVRSKVTTGNQFLPNEAITKYRQMLKEVINKEL